MTRYWFKPRQYGYGAAPVTWQGWALTVAAVVVVVAATRLLAVQSAESPWFWLAILIDGVAIATLLIVSRKKTDGEWRWRWGASQ